jgi:hypothetical protein
MAEGASGSTDARLSRGVPTMRVAWFGAVALCLGFLTTSTAKADGTYDELLVNLPDTSNVLILMDLKAIKQSPIGKKEDYAHKHESEYLAGTTGISPNVQKLALAAQIEPGTLKNTWEIGVASVNQKISMAKVAKAHGGAQDTVDGKNVVFTPRNAAFVELGPNTMGYMRPANRQALARWLRTTKNNTKTTISPYLQAAAARAKDSQIILALDLTDMLDEGGVLHRLQQCQTLKGAKDDLKPMAKTITGVKGITLAVQFDQVITGELTVDFSGSIDPIKSVAKRLLLEAIDEAGAHIEDFDAWPEKSEGNTVTLRGKMSPKGLRQILSLVTPPADSVETQTSGDSTTPEDPKVLATQRYLMALTSYLGDLKGESKRARSFEKMAVWYDKYADKIDNLPILDVDQDMLNYGSNTSSALRNIAQSARGAPIAQSTLRNQEASIQAAGAVPYGFYGPYGGAHVGWGYQYLDVNNYKQIQNLQKDVRNNEYEERMNIWDSIAKATADIRRKMVEKYKVDFKVGGDI